MDIGEYVPLAPYSSYRIGGPARYFVQPKKPGDIKTAQKFARRQGLPYYILGSGTNVLISDTGIDGVVIKIGKEMAQIQLDGEKVTVGAGLSLNKLIHYLAQFNRGGFEMLAGIPGSVGGAVVMNAGAFGVFIGQFVQSVSIISEKGSFEQLKKEDLGFAYRTSVLQNSKHILYEVLLGVQEINQENIKENITKAAKHRRRHPLLPSCGSIFRNPPGIPAGKLIEEMGLKGTRCGDAQISPEHGNFIVNHGRATAQDVYSLIRLVKEEASRLGIELQTEVKLWGDFGK
jgi:UDP-N-acetylmuramate dehydrogenase